VDDFHTFPPFDEWFTIVENFNAEFDFSSSEFIAPRRQERKERHLPISPNLARFASLRESSFCRFRDPNIQQKISNIFG